MSIMTNLTLLTFLWSIPFISDRQIHRVNIQSEELQTSTEMKIEMVPVGLEREAPEKPYKVSSKFYIKIIARNDTDSRIRVVVVDPYYQNRPRLFKEGQLIPYRNEAKKNFEAKENYPEFVRPGSVVFLEPYSSRQLAQLNLSDWYPPLQPGLYQLINRYRVDIDGPWTTDSTALLFEVVSQD